MSALVQEFNMDNFDTAVLQAEGKVLVDFWAPWCGPCRMVGPLIEELASDFAGRVLVGKVNVDDCMEVAERYRVMNIPTVAVFEKGEMVQKLVGAHPKAEYAKLLG